MKYIGDKKRIVILILILTTAIIDFKIFGILILALYNFFIILHIMMCAPLLLIIYVPSAIIIYRDIPYLRESNLLSIILGLLISTLLIFILYKFVPILGGAIICGTTDIEKIEQFVRYWTLFY